MSLRQAALRGTRYWDLKRAAGLPSASLGALGVGRARGENPRMRGNLASSAFWVNGLHAHRQWDGEHKNGNVQSATEEALSPGEFRVVFV